MRPSPEKPDPDYPGRMLCYLDETTGKRVVLDVQKDRDRVLEECRKLMALALVSKRTLRLLALAVPKALGEVSELMSEARETLVCLTEILKHLETKYC